MSRHSTARVLDERLGLLLRDSDSGVARQGMGSPRDIHPTIHKPFVLTTFLRLRVMTQDSPRPASSLLVASDDHGHITSAGRARFHFRTTRDVGSPERLGLQSIFAVLMISFSVASRLLAMHPSKPRLNTVFSTSSTPHKGTGTLRP